MGPGGYLSVGTDWLLKRGHPVGEARASAESLLAGATGLDRGRMLMDPSRRLRADEAAVFAEFLSRRGLGEPVAYILGHKEFWSLPLKVTRDVLIPRPETETLVEAVLAWLGRRGGQGPGAGAREGDPLIVDLGTGSGAIALALATGIPAARIIATDISPRALEVARENAVALSLGDRIEFRAGDAWDPLGDMAGGTQRSAGGGWVPGADVIVSNPPYVSAGEFEGLMPEVRDYEPREALDGGPDGLRLIRRLVEGAPRYLRDGGLLGLEIGWDQAAAVRAMVRARGAFAEPRVLQDLAGRDRVVLAEKVHPDPEGIDG